MNLVVLILGFVALFAAFIIPAVQAGKAESMLRARIQQSLESQLALEGVENCENKCDKAFNKVAYMISAADGRRTYEFQACVKGCNQCTQDRLNGASPSNCFETCKNFNWHSDGLVKGVIEPDKACLGGCVINTCQVICTGGTTDPDITPQNKHLFWPNGGCAIKTEPYSQNLEYVPFDSPNTGQGGSEGAASCCANAMSLCGYVGDTNSENYIQLLANTISICNEFVPNGNLNTICAWFNNPQNCGAGVLAGL